MAYLDLKTEDEAPRRAAELTFGGLEGSLSFNMRLAQIAWSRDHIVALKALDLTQKQYVVLALVGANPGVSQIDLAGLLDTDRATMMAIIDRLQDRGFVRRAPSKADRRRQELHLTPCGEAARAQGEAICHALEEPILARFTAAERAMLFDLLKRLRG